MSSLPVLACDIGAGSGRLLSVEYGNGKKALSIRELSRFRNGPVQLGSSLYWDIVGIYANLAEALAAAPGQGVRAASLGIDTWGNDFALLDTRGCLLENPYSYRDARTADAVAFVERSISARELYRRNGIQQVRMNTFYQLVSLAEDRPHILAAADRLLFIPDLLTYFLTGDIGSEYTLATISQLYSYRQASWDRELMDLFHIPPRLFPPIVEPGSRRGTVLSSICRDSGVPPLPVITVGGHDTASAVVGVPEPRGNAVYISSGTWSIAGTETDSPVINDTAFRYNFSNEGGVGGRNRLVKNVMGLWILQEIQRNFAVRGKNYGFDEISELAASAEPFGPLIDPDDLCFYEPADMPGMIRAYCARTGQRVPESDGEVVRCAFESLALKYRYVVEKLSLLTGRPLDTIHIVGGGARNRLLCQLTADYCRCRVLAGPDEATALGNAMTQLIALGELSGLEDARSVIRAAFPPIEYHPSPGDGWDARYETFLNLLTCSDPSVP